jgi:energy-coupling factor transport system ATP-binding protein
LFSRSVYSEVAFAPRLRGVHADELSELVERALRRTGLESVAEEHPYDLPPAQRKLVAIAAALAQEPQLMVLDEPTQGLDRSSAARVTEVVDGLASEDVAVLAVTHDLSFVAEALNRSLVLAEGELVHDGGSRDLVWGGTRAAHLGLESPQAAQLSRALDLPGMPVRVDDVVHALRTYVN